MCNARLRALFVSASAAGLLVFSAQTAAAASSLIYVTNSGGDNIHVVDPSTHRVVSMINGI
jgi:YVTN family beta-propeller protein